MRRCKVGTRDGGLGRLRTCRQKQTEETTNELVAERIPGGIHMPIAIYALVCKCVCVCTCAKIADVIALNGSTLFPYFE